MEIRRCMKCMHELKPGQSVCPECGQVFGSGEPEAFALRPGTILNGTYLVGEMLGQGGFGITYIGFDLLLEQKVAIKEYFPMSTGMVSRENCTSVVWSKTMMAKSGAQKGFDSFLKEARKMAKLGEIPSVVGVKAVFIQNETAYIVMDFIEGETLLKKLQREGPMDFNACVSLLTPIMQALAEVHRHGVIHRDISPDNIMVRKNGKLSLLDLGAAKDLDIQGADGTMQSSQLVAKQGFSPFEQYGRNGKVGPWTDVYAMAATIYYCCTGKLPPSAIDRIENDTLSCQPLLTQPQFDALAACMTILPGNRPQSMDAMLQMVSQTTGKAETPRPEPPKPEPPKPEPPKPEPARPAPAVQTPEALFALASDCDQKGDMNEAVKLYRQAAELGHAGAQCNLGYCLIEGMGTCSDAEQAVEWFRKSAAQGNDRAQNCLGLCYSNGNGVPRNHFEAVKWYRMAAEQGNPNAQYNLSTKYASGEGVERNPEKAVSWCRQAAAQGLEDAKMRLPQLEAQLVQGSQPFSSTPSPQPVQPKRKSSLLKWLLPLAAAGLVLLAIAIGIGSGKQPDADDDGKNIAATTAPTESTAATTAPTTRPTVPATQPTETIPAGVHMMAAAEFVRGIDSDESAGQFFWGQTTYRRRDVETVTFQDTLDGVPGDAWDVSEAGNKSVLAWMDGGDLYVAANGKIAMNPNEAYRFDSFVNLKKIDFGDCLDTANVKYMGDMFHNCSSLKSLDLSGFDTSNVTDMAYMFLGCSNLTSLDVSGFDTSNVTEIFCMFQACSNLTKLDVSSFDTTNVTDMNNMFGGCSSLTSLDLSGFNTAKVTDMWNMFYNCSSLTSLDVSSLDTSNVTDMWSMFEGCSSLTSLDVSGLDTSNVTNMRSMFERCSSLTSLDLSGFNTAKVTDMWNMFYNCSSLTSLDVSSLDTSNVTDMSYMFYGCSRLKSLDLSGFDTANVTDMGFMFADCSSLTSLDLSSFDTANVTDMGFMFLRSDSLTDLRCSNQKILAEYNKRR